MNPVHNDADALSQQIVKSADVELLAFVRCVELARDKYAVPHDAYVLIERMLRQQGVDVPPREQRFRAGRIGCRYVQALPRAKHLEEFGK